MGVSKVILNGNTIMDVTQDTVASSNLVTGFTATGADGESVSGEVAEKTALDVTMEGAVVIIPPGFYSANAEYTVPSASVTLSPISGLRADVMVEGDVVTLAKSVPVTPEVLLPGYISEGTPTNVYISLSTEMGTLDANVYTPTTEDQVIEAWQLLVGSQVIEGDPNLIPENIKQGVTIFGVTGTYEGSGGLPAYDGSWYVANNSESTSGETNDDEPIENPINP